jgi:hypothetical protein
MLDFIDWVTTSQELIHRGLGLAAAAGAPAVDDDFAKIEEPLGSSTTSAAAAAAGYYPHSETTPFLSKTAEAELYLLATNFLLCESFLVLRGALCIVLVCARLCWLCWLC